MRNPKRVLILGGTTEAAELAARLTGDPRVKPMLSLAGRTLAPRRPAIPSRIGGFGGVDGLVHWLGEESTDRVIDATHPFAVRMSANAVAATARLGLPLLTVLRPRWQPDTGDRWEAVATMADAVAALGPEPRRVWLTIGGNELAAFRAAPWHTYLVRTVDPPPAEALPPFATVLTARGPFAPADEGALIARHRIEVLVTKNSGGDATAAKLSAARATGLRVVMVERPPKPARRIVATVRAALDWLMAED